jgi:hypothetical protein
VTIHLLFLSLPEETIDFAMAFLEAPDGRVVEMLSESGVVREGYLLTNKIHPETKQLGIENYGTDPVQRKNVRKVD